jgi:hypothetical protein
MTLSEIENFKKQLKSCFEEHQQGKIYFIKKFLEKNKNAQDPIDFLLRSLPEKYKANIAWADIEDALGLMTDD